MPERKSPSEPAPPAALPQHAAIFPKRRAVPPVSWPLQRHDWWALIAAVCFAAVFWNYRHVILPVLGCYFLLRGWLWLCRRHPPCGLVSASFFQSKIAERYCGWVGAGGSNS